jgi:hypothetical protein
MVLNLTDGKIFGQSAQAAVGVGEQHVDFQKIRRGERSNGQTSAEKSVYRSGKMTVAPKADFAWRDFKL